MNQLDDFINEILNKKQLPGMNEDVRADVIDDMKTSLLDQINRALIDALPDDKLDEFQQLLDDEAVNDDAIQDFIQRSGVDVSAVTATTLLRFRDLYLQGENEQARD